MQNQQICFLSGFVFVVCVLLFCLFVVVLCCCLRGEDGLLSLLAQMQNVCSREIIIIRFVNAQSTM